MRKILLSLAVALLATAGFAQEALWESSIAAFDAATKPEFASPAAMDNDGNLYVTGTQTQNFEFAGKDVEVLAMGTYIAKYNANGKETFAFALQGAVTITAITTDADNNLYVAGKFADVAFITDAEGASQEIKSSEPDTQSAAFIAKYDANGKLVTVKSYEGAHNLPDGAEFWGSPAYVSISKLLVEGTNVYVQVTSNASVAMGNGISFVPKYSVEDYSAFGMGLVYFDMVSHSLIAFDSDLNAVENVATFAAADGASAATNMAMNFTVEGSDVYVAAYALGNITLTTSAGTESFDFAINDDYTTEKGVVVAKVGSKAVKFAGTADEDYYSFYRIADMNAQDGKLYMAGTFQSAFAFDNAVTSVGKTDLFVVALDAAELALDWSYVNAFEEGEMNKFFEKANVIFGKDKIQIVEVVYDMNSPMPVNAKNYEVSLSGKAEEYAGAVSTAVAYNDNYVAFINCSDATYVKVYEAKDFAVTSIDEIVAENASNAIYDLTGRRVGQVTKPGIYIINGVKKLVK